MDGMHIMVEKVPGGTDGDAWSARMVIENAECSMRVASRGESRQHARANLAYAINRVLRETNAVAAELVK